MKLHTKILLGLVLGAGLGIGLNVLAHQVPWAPSIVPVVDWIAGKVDWFAGNVASPVGQIFLRLLLMTVIPLVFCSITLGVAGLGDIRKVGRIGVRSIGYFLVSTAISATIGILLVNYVRPGEGLSPELRDRLMATYQSQVQGLGAGGTAKFGVDMLVNFFPRNPIQAAATMDMIGLIVFSIIFGAALTLIPEDKVKPVVRVLDAVGEAIVKIIGMVMRLAPYGVFGLIFFVTWRLGLDIVFRLGAYVFVVLAGLVLHGVGSLSVLVRVAGGLRPTLFFSRIRDSIMTAFSTSSSNATLPTNIAVAEQELKIPPEIAGFVLPLGSTMCMNGTALFEGVTVLFLAQLFGISLDVPTQLVVIVMSVITAVGAAGVPGGSLPLLMVVLASVGVPPEGIGVVLGVDRILDMCRTTVNVVGDLTAVVYVARTESEWDPRAVGSAAALAPAG